MVVKRRPASKKRAQRRKRKQTRRKQSGGQAITLGVLGIFKNEAMVIREWIEHYLWQGADYVVLMNNGSTDDWEEKIKDLPKDKVFVLDTPQQHNQQGHMTDTGFPWMREKKVDVVAVLDLDEFLFVTDGRKLKDVVQEVFGKPDRPSQFTCKWTMFGSSDLEKQPESIRKSLTWKAKDQWKEIKSVTWVNDIDLGKSAWPIQHSVGVTGKVMECPPGVQLNHYAIQSKEYFEKVKMTRGDVSTSASNSVRNWDYFKRYDFHELEDTVLRDQVIASENK